MIDDRAGAVVRRTGLLIHMLELLEWLLEKETSCLLAWHRWTHLEASGLSSKRNPRKTFRTGSVVGGGIARKTPIVSGTPVQSGSMARELRGAFRSCRVQ